MVVVVVVVGNSDAIVLTTTSTSTTHSGRRPNLRCRIIIINILVRMILFGKRRKCGLL